MHEQGLATAHALASQYLSDGSPSNSTSSVGFVTGCHMANFTCLAAARHEVLHRAGWNVETHRSADTMLACHRARVS